MEAFLTVASWLAPPLLGGLIGYATNSVAIAMLFRPRNEKRLFGIRIPLTPGLIPRHHGRMAHHIAQMVGTELLSEQAIRNAFRTEPRRGLARARGVLRGRLVDLLVRLRRRMPVEKVVEARIKEASTEKLELLVLSVTKEHLRWITWFGALLGALIGCLQLVLNLFS